MLTSLLFISKERIWHPNFGWICHNWKCRADVHPQAQTCPKFGINKLTKNEDDLPARPMLSLKAFGTELIQRLFGEQGEEGELPYIVAEKAAVEEHSKLSAL